MEQPQLDVERHIKYWRRCLTTLLPTEYTSTDSSRMAFGFFILSALDLLGAGADTLPEEERTRLRDWILHCQHPHGGFCGSSNHRFPDVYYAGSGSGKQEVDPANLAATFFAILSLGFVGSLDQVKRLEGLQWLRTLQRDDGSFGELVSLDGTIEGGRDMRYCLMVAATRWMLRDDSLSNGLEYENDINVEKLVNHITSGQTYDGGISESSKHEAHAGYTYCAIASLSLLDCLPELSLSSRSPSLTTSMDHPAVIRWLVSRQISYAESDDDEEEEKFDSFSVQDQRNALAGIYNDHAASTREPPSIDSLSLQDGQIIGFNGRMNKKPDTCYSFWVAASLDMLGQAQLIDSEGLRHFLLLKTQHRIGGFGKVPGAPPDIYHSYLGLAALATMNEKGVKELDSALCVSKAAKGKLDRLRKDALVPLRTYWKHGYPFSIRENDPEFQKRMAESEQPSSPLMDVLTAASRQKGEVAT